MRHGRRVRAVPGRKAIGASSRARSRAGLPNWLAAKVRELHPIVDSGSTYQAMLLMRLCADEALAARGSGRGQRPLTTGEITTNWRGLCRAVAHGMD